MNVKSPNGTFASAGAVNAANKIAPQIKPALTVFQLPSYSPDYNPIEYLWRKTKRLATHNQYFAEFVQLIASVEQALAKFARSAADVLTLLGFYCDETGMPREFTA